MIDFDLPENGKNDWLTIGKVVKGTLPPANYPDRVEITVLDSDATEWDCYLDGIARGLFSRRFVDAVGREGLNDFALMPASIKDAESFFLRIERTTHCIDRERSRVITFPHDRARVMQVEHFAFHEEVLAGKSKLFCIPESAALLSTEAMARRIARAGLRGVAIEELP